MQRVANKMNQKVPYGFIYMTVNKINGMKYIGKCIYQRQNDWQKYLGSGLYLQRAIRKYGKENFEKHILVEAFSKEELNRLEEEYIFNLDAVNSQEYYNVKLTAIGGDIFSNNPRKEEIREMRRKQMSGKGNHQYGRAKTAKMIESVRQANSSAVIIEGIYYKSQTEVAKTLNLGITTVSYRLDSDTYPEWKRISPKKKVQKKSNNPTCKVNVNGLVYESIKAAAESLGVSTSTVIRRLDSEKYPNYKRLSEKIR